MTAALQATGLHKRFGARTAVAQLDLVVEPGEIVGLLGPNGAGKTTSMSMIAGLLTPDRGQVRIAGHDLATAPRLAKAALGYVPQELALYGSLSARQNLAYFVALAGVPATARAGAITQALAVAGLADRADDRVDQFSGGMQRRLNFACGIAHRPRVVILDEPTVGVDPQSRAHLFAATRALADDGLAVLFTSHHMDEVESLCHRVAILDEGRVIAEGTPAALMAAHAPGGFELELTTADPAFSEWLRAHPDGLEHTPGSAVVVVRQQARLADITAEAARRELHWAALRSHASNFDAVFLRLTGRSLRD